LTQTAGEFLDVHKHDLLRATHPDGTVEYFRVLENRGYRLDVKKVDIRVPAPLSHGPVRNVKKGKVARF